MLCLDKDHRKLVRRDFRLDHFEVAGSLEAS